MVFSGDIVQKVARKEAGEEGEVRGISMDIDVTQG